MLVGYLLLDIPNGHGILKNSHVIPWGPGLHNFFNKLKPFRHRHRLDFFTRWAWVKDIKIGNILGTSTWAHNSYGFQKKRKKEYTLFYELLTHNLQIP
jgi:hypothetical protein